MVERLAMDANNQNPKITAGDFNACAALLCDGHINNCPKSKIDRKSFTMSPFMVLSAS